MEEINTLTDEQEKELMDAFEQNDPKFNLTKLAEELTELAEVCLKKVNKDEFHAPSDDSLISEAGDVMIRLMIVLEKVDNAGDKLEAAVDKKMRHLHNLRDKYKGFL